jgi:hypothetical protein
MPDWSKYARRSPGEAATLEKATTRARAAREAHPGRRRGQEFARITEDMFPLMVGLSGPAILLLEMLVMLSGRRKTRLCGGWVTLPRVVLRTIALEDRGARSRAIQRLTTKGFLETRQLGPGRALEYRLRLPTPPDTTTH